MTRSRHTRPAGSRPQPASDAPGRPPPEPSAEATRTESTPVEPDPLEPARDESALGEAAPVEPGAEQPPLASAGPAAGPPAGAAERAHTGDGGGGRAAALGALAGLVATAVVLAILYYAGWLGPRDTELPERVAALESETAAVRALEPRIGGTEGGLSELGGRLRGAQDSLGQLDQRLDGVDGALRALDQRLQELGAQPALEGTPQVDLGALQTGQQNLEAALAAVQADLAQQRQLADAGLAELRAAGGELAQALEQLRGEVAAQRDALGPLGQRLDGLDQTLAAQAQRDEALAGQLAAVEQRVAGAEEAVRNELQGLRGEVQAALQTLQSGFGSQLQSLQAGFRSELQEVKDAATTAQAMALVLTDLGTAIDEGQPVAAPLDRLAPLATDDPTVAGAVSTLERFREQGVPTRAALRARLDELEQAIAADRPPPPADSWLGQARQNLTGLVTVREADPVTTTTELAIEAARTALDQDNVTAAAQALRPLAESGNAAAQAWIASAEDRLAAEAAFAALRSHLETVLTLVR
ncbi:MAG TPA: hypothetical protein VFG43_13510 [Geminicoccaceae bacterium]|nr:hypothetical protein [Geminicoccaceae bacterium]